MRSKVDSFAIDQAYHHEQIDELLLETAEKRAWLMQCVPPQMDTVDC